MPLHPLNGGFSSTPGEKKPCAKGPCKQKEQLGILRQIEAPISVQNRYSILTPSTDEDSLEIVVTNSDHGVKNKPHKTRRGFNKNQHVKRQSTTALKVLATNCAGVRGKVSSLKSEVKHAAVNLVILQETHSKRKGQIQFPNMMVFEAIRKVKGGGNLIASHEDLNPKLIKDYDDEFELLVVEIETKGKQIRVISGYGPKKTGQRKKECHSLLL